VELFHHNFLQAICQTIVVVLVVNVKLITTVVSCMPHLPSSSSFFFCFCINTIYEPDLRLIVIDGCSCSKTVAK
jgi:hypothetical protein